MIERERSRLPTREPVEGSDSRGLLETLVDPTGELAPGHRAGVWRDALLRRMLAVADAAAVVLVSVAIGVAPEDGADAGLWSAVLLPVWLLLAKLHGLYDRDQRSLRHLTVDELPGVFLWALTGTATMSFLLMLTPAGSLELTTLLRAAIVAGVAAFVLRSVARLLWRWSTPPELTLIVGDGALAAATRRKLELFPDTHVQLVAGEAEVTLDELREHRQRLAQHDRVILASQTIDEAVIAELVAFCREAHVKLSVVPPARGMFGTAVRLDHLADLPIVEYNTWDVSRSTLFLKRVLDVAVATVALVVLLPVCVAVAGAILVDSGRPVLFAQRRAGMRGAPFDMFKFRTMVRNAEDLLGELVTFGELREPMFKLVNDPRVTRVGRFLRRTSLDEIPQLFNVVRGDMSLVGPRPEQVELVERYLPEYRFRLAVKPGITGPMQVYGRGDLTFEERLAVEREYVENVSLRRDLRILALTVSAIFGGRGAF